MCSNLATGSPPSSSTKCLTPEKTCRDPKQMSHATLVDISQEHTDCGVALQTCLGRIITFSLHMPTCAASHQHQPLLHALSCTKSDCLLLQPPCDIPNLFHYFWIYAFSIAMLFLNCVLVRSSCTCPSSEHPYCNTPLTILIGVRRMH